MADTNTTSTRSKITWLGLGLALTVGAGLLISTQYSPFEPTIVPAPPSALTAAPIQEDLSPPKGVAVDHVKVGQTYHFEGLGQTTVWRVKKITRTEILYEAGELRNGSFASRGTFQFARRDAPQTTPGLAKVGRERVEVSGSDFDCGVYEAQGLKTWSANKFPGTIRTMSGERVVRALVKIEQG